MWKVDQHRRQVSGEWLTFHTKANGNRDQEVVGQKENKRTNLVNIQEIKISSTWPCTVYEEGWVLRTTHRLLSFCPVWMMTPLSKTGNSGRRSYLMVKMICSVFPVLSLRYKNNWAYGSIVQRQKVRTRDLNFGVI